MGVVADAAHRWQGGQKTARSRALGQDRLCRLGFRRSGLQFHTTINDWHTCPAGGEIRASNPCSEYMFLDDTACNLASLNLLQFRDPTTKSSTSRPMNTPCACGLWCWKSRC